MKCCNILNLLVVGILFYSPAIVHAHRANVFAWAEDDIITVESSFSGGRKMVHGTITVQREDSDQVIVSGKTDKNGLFTFTIPPAISENKPILKIVANGGDGHQASWIMKPEDYLGDDQTIEPAGPLQKAISEDPPQKSSSANSCSDLSLEALDHVLETKLGPIRRDIASLSNPSPSIQEIIGGIGYLIGLAGLAAWIKSRKK